MPNGSRVACMAAPSQDHANPDCPCRSLHGEKWSEDIAARKPASSARTTASSSFAGWTCSCELWIPYTVMRATYPLDAPVMLVPMSEDLTVRGSVAIPRAELQWRFSRSGGPGGQGVNTTDSKVELRWNLAETSALPPALKQRALNRLAGRLVDGALVITSSEQRAQLQNRRSAEIRLVALVRDAIAPDPPTRRPTKPSRGAVERRLESKRRRSLTKRNRRTGD